MIKLKTYLVTGGAGFIGSNFIKYMLYKYNDIKIICLDKLTYAGNLANIEYELENYSDKLEFIKGDIINKELVEYIFDNWDITFIVNFAAESHVDRSIEDADVFLETNVVGVQNLLNVAKDKWETEERDYSQQTSGEFVIVNYLHSPRCVSCETPSQRKDFGARCDQERPQGTRVKNQSGHQQ